MSSGRVRRLVTDDGEGVAHGWAALGDAVEHGVDAQAQCVALRVLEALVDAPRAAAGLACDGSASGAVLPVLARTDDVGETGAVTEDLGQRPRLLCAQPVQVLGRRRLRSMRLRQRRHTPRASGIWLM